MPRRKPRVISPCSAERHSMQDHTRVIEFAGATSGERGGLIEFRDLEQHMLVLPYVLGSEVRVNVKPEHLWLTPNDWAALERQIALHQPNSKLAQISVMVAGYRAAVAKMSSEELVTYATRMMDGVAALMQDIPQAQDG